METNDNLKLGVFLEPEQYAELINSLILKCEQWLVGELRGEHLIVEFDRVRSTRWKLRGLSGLPDDFDWSTIPSDVLDRGEELCSKFHQAGRMMKAAEKAVDSLRTLGKDGVISRAYYFGVYARELHFALQR